MTTDVMTKIVERIDWKAFKESAQTRLEQAMFSSVDMQTTKGYIVAIIESSLSVYVDKVFMIRFRIEVDPVSDSFCEVKLFFGERELARWELTLDPYVF